MKQAMCKKFINKAGVCFAMKRLMNKSGQEGGSPTTFLIGLVVVVVFGIFLVLFLTGVFNKTDVVTEIAPGDLEAALQGCKADVQQNFIGDYCTHLRPVESGFVTCEFKQVEDALVAQQLSPINCPTNNNDPKKASIELCKEQIKLGNVDSNTRINGYLCAAEVSCSDIGQRLDSGSACANAGAVKLTKGYKDSDKPCCVA